MSGGYDKNTKDACNNVISLKGIEKLTNLVDIDYRISSTINMDKLDLSSNLNLESIELVGARLNKLDISKNSKLSSIVFSNSNKIDSLYIGDLNSGNIITKNLNGLWSSNKIDNIYLNRTDYWQNNVNKVLTETSWSYNLFDKDNHSIDNLDNFSGDFIKVVGKYDAVNFMISFHIVDKSNEKDSTDGQGDTKDEENDNTKTDEQKTTKEEANTEKNPNTTTGKITLIALILLVALVAINELLILKRRKKIRN